MDKVIPNKITVALTIDQVDAHNDNYNALADKDIEIFNALSEKINDKSYFETAAVVEDVDLFKIYINPSNIISTTFKSQEEVINYIKSLKFSFIPAESTSPTDVAITASYLENDTVSFFLYTASFSNVALYSGSAYTIEYSESKSAWVVSE